MSARLRASVAALVVAVLAGCAAPEPPAAVPALRPELARSGEMKDPVGVGVLVPPVEGAGAEFRPLVEGARVAAYRFGLGGDRVELRVGLDDGTADGARRAMAALLDAGVAGVLLASPGAHTAEALALAAGARTAVLLPYGSAVGQVPGAWSLAPATDAVAARVADALGRAGASRPYRASVAGDDPAGTAAWVGTLAGPAATAQEVVTLLEERRVDSVVVDGPAAEQAALVVALQGLLGTRQLPVVLTPPALTPAFGDLLAASGASGGRLVGVGAGTPEHGAPPDAGTDGRAAVFLTAVRLAAGDPTCRNVYDDDGCADGVPRGDAASHDATVALVRAADAAGSVDPARVRDALAGLRLSGDDGLAGPALDFAGYQALSDDDVVVLHASTSDPGVRPTAADGSRPALFWFAEAAP